MNIVQLNPLFYLVWCKMTPKLIFQLQQSVKPKLAIDAGFDWYFGNINTSLLTSKTTPKSTDCTLQLHIIRDATVKLKNICF